MHTILNLMKRADGILIASRRYGPLAVSAERGENLLPLLHSLEQLALAYGMRVVHRDRWPEVGAPGKGNEAGDVLNGSAAIAWALGRSFADAAA